jgi:hypothetical protein
MNNYVDVFVLKENNLFIYTVNMMIDDKYSIVSITELAIQ